MIEQFAGQAAGVAILFAQLGKDPGALVAHAEASVRSGHPQPPNIIFGYGRDVRAFGPRGTGRKMLYPLPIVAVQAALRSDPDVARMILENARDGIVAEAILRSDMLEAQLLRRARGPSTGTKQC